MKDLENMSLQTFRLSDLGVYRVDIETRKIFTVSEKFKCLSEVDQDFINIIHKDLPNPNNPLKKYNAIFRVLNRQYQSLSNSNSTTRSILTSSSYFKISLTPSIEYLYKISILFDGSPLLRNIHGLALHKHSLSTFIATGPIFDEIKGRLEKLGSYTETSLPRVVRDWVDKNKAGELSIYSREGCLLFDYLKSLINKKCKELDGEDTIKL